MLFSLLFSKLNLIPSLDRMVGRRCSGRQSEQFPGATPRLQRRHSSEPAEWWVVVYLESVLLGRVIDGQWGLEGVSKGQKLMEMAFSPRFIRDRNHLF